MTVHNQMGGSATTQKMVGGHTTRLIGTLVFAGAIAGLLIVLSFMWADPRILAHKAAVLQAAIADVLNEPAKVQTLFVLDGALTATVPAGTDTVPLEKVYVGFDASGKPVGYAIQGAKPGFADVISLIFGYDATSKKVIGMKVLDNKETPGLGDKIVLDTAFVGEFSGVATPLKGVKSGAGKGAANEVDLITGATISTRTVVSIVNESLARVVPLIEKGVKQ